MCSLADGVARCCSSLTNPILSLLFPCFSLRIACVSTPAAMDALRVARVDGVTIQYFHPPTAPDQKPIPRTQIGQLHLTPHHLIFSHTPSTAYKPEIWIPYPLITRLTRLPQTLNGLYPLQVETKTFESYVLLFTNDRDGGAEEVWQSVKDCSVKCKYHTFLYR